MRASTSPWPFTSLSKSDSIWVREPASPSSSPEPKR